MAFLQIEVTQDDIQKLDLSLESMKRRSRDLLPPLHQGGILMLRSIDLNFRQSGRPRKWKPLSKLTLKRKVQAGFSSKPLIRTGLLKRSITFSVVGKTKLSIGTPVLYGSYHQFGTKFIPKRPFLVFHEEDIDRINQLILMHITGVTF